MDKFFNDDSNRRPLHPKSSLSSKTQQNSTLTEQERQQLENEELISLAEEFLPFEVRKSLALLIIFSFFVGALFSPIVAESCFSYLMCSYLSTFFMLLIVRVTMFRSLTEISPKIWVVVASFLAFTGLLGGFCQWLLPSHLKMKVNPLAYKIRQNIFSDLNSEDSQNFDDIETDSAFDNEQSKNAVIRKDSNHHID